MLTALETKHGLEQGRDYKIDADGEIIKLFTSDGNLVKINFDLLSEIKTRESAQQESDGL